MYSGGQGEAPWATGLRTMMQGIEQLGQGLEKYGTHKTLNTAAEGLMKEKPEKFTGGEGGQRQAAAMTVVGQLGEAAKLRKSEELTKLTPGQLYTQAARQHDPEMMKTALAAITASRTVVGLNTKDMPSPRTVNVDPLGWDLSALEPILAKAGYKTEDLKNPEKMKPSDTGFFGGATNESLYSNPAAKAMIDYGNKLQSKYNNATEEQKLKLIPELQEWNDSFNTLGEQIYMGEYGTVALEDLKRDSNAYNNQMGNIKNALFRATTYRKDNIPGQVPLTFGTFPTAVGVGGPKTQKIIKFPGTKHPDGSKSKFVPASQQTEEDKDRENVAIANVMADTNTERLQVILSNPDASDAVKQAATNRLMKLKSAAPAPKKPQGQVVTTGSRTIPMVDDRGRPIGQQTVPTYNYQATPEEIAERERKKKEEAERSETLRRQTIEQGQRRSLRY